MTIYIVEATARADIREYWRVEADSEDEAREAIEDGGGIAAEFLFDETTGNEEEREVSTVHSGNYMDGTLDLRRAESAAPAMLAALQWAESFVSGFEDDELQEGIDDNLSMIRAAIAAALGEPLPDTPTADATGEIEREG